MNTNRHASNNLYKSRVLKLSAAQYIINILCFGSITCIFLYGSYSIFTPEFGYLIAILVVAIISVLNGKTLQLPYWYFRPKVNQSLFSNLFNVYNLIFSSLCIILILLNYRTESFQIEFGLLGSVIFLLGLPLSFYFWMVFSQTNEKAIIEIIDKESFKVFKNYEVYFILIFIAMLGLLFDFLPQNVYATLYIPIGLLLIFSISKIFLNRSIHSTLNSHFQTKTSKSSGDANKLDAVDLSFDKSPYTVFHQLSNDFYSKPESQQKKLLFSLKRVSAVDTISALENLIENRGESNQIHQLLIDTVDYLKKLNAELDEIENPYEFIEQSNNLPLLKALIRKQTTNTDKNLIIKLLNDNRISINKPACIVAGYYDDINIISILIEHLGRPEVSHWAQIALKRIGAKCVKYLEIEFSKRKENLVFVESCFQLICEIRNETAYDLLFKSLNETNGSIRKIAAKKIIVHNVEVTNTHRKYFTRLFDHLTLTVLSNSYLVEQLEVRNESFKTLKTAIENENREALFLIVNIIKLYYNPEATEKIFKNYKNDEPESHAASLMLIDLLIDDNLSLKNRLKVLFSPNERILLESIQEEFPSVNLKPEFKTEEDLIWYILRKEYSEINSWTRACALNILHYTFKEDIPFELASEFLNKNKLLKETAAINIFINLPEFYTIFLSRLTDDDAKEIDYLVRSNLDIANPKQINQDNLLLEDKLKFLINTPYLSDLSISEIVNMHIYFRTKVLRAGEHQISLHEEANLGFWIIQSGNASFSKNGIDFYDFSKKDIITVSDDDSTTQNVFFYLEQDTRFLIIEEIIFFSIIARQEEILQKYIDILPDNKPSKIIKKLKQEAA